MAERWEAYQMLAIAVLEQAWKDARKGNRSGKNSREFLSTPSPSLCHWSDQAGLPSQWIIARVKGEFPA
jgi:hypothetical protein